MACPTAPQPDEEDGARATEAELLGFIRNDVWSGEYDPDEVLLMIEDQFDPEEYDEAWVRAAIRREFVAKRRAEKTWPEVTDCDRLDRAFEALDAHGIVAEDIIPYTQADGYDYVSEIYREAGGKKSKFSGYCFYTVQDQEAALDGGLYISFGHFSGAAKKAVEVGRLVRAELERAGLTVVWDETSGTRLYLRDFRWQRRG